MNLAKAPISGLIDIAVADFLKILTQRIIGLISFYQNLVAYASRNA